jgi:hypothetical protein
VDAFNLLSDCAENSNLRLVHGYVTSKRSDGKRYRHSHAWVEDLDASLVLDYANGRRNRIARDKYYDSLSITRTVAYTFKKARLKMLQTMHYGPWADWLEEGEKLV